MIELQIFFYAVDMTIKIWPLLEFLLIIWLLYRLFHCHFFYGAFYLVTIHIANYIQDDIQEKLKL